MTVTPDDRDRRILALLREDAWLTYAALATRVNLSPSAVQRRVERLIEGGVLLGARAEIADQAAAGLIVFLLAELVNDSAGTLQAFARAMQGAPEVREAHYVTGEADVVLKLGLADMAHYDRFVAAHVNHSPLVRRFKTFAVLRSLA